jgi:multidrug resistance protein MdtO
MDTHSAAVWPRYRQFLRVELAPYPGRWNLVLRCLLGCALVIVISMAQQVPLLALSLLAVFYVTQSNVVLTRMVGIMFVLGSTLGVACTILLLKCTFDFPLLRILMAGVLLFGCVYLIRVTRVGVAFFIAAISIIYAQSFVDRIASPELIMRLNLWVWVAVNYPIMLALLINTLFLPAEPEQQLKAEIQRQLMTVESAIAHAADSAQPSPTIDRQAVRQGVLSLQKLLRFTTMRNPRYLTGQAQQLACIATVSRLYELAYQLTRHAGQTGDSDAWDAPRAGCRQLAEAIAGDRPFQFAIQAETDAAKRLPAAAQAMLRTLRAYADQSAQPSASTTAPAAKQGFLAQDAFSNPVYTQFALKTVLATLIGYVFYVAIDWPGIHTIMLTCVIVAQPSLGATSMRSILRIVGALIGSGLALFMVVFIIPHLEDIVGLLLMTMPVLALGAWIAAGSERSAYAGTQIMFTFSLALLGDFGPVTDLTEIRDRMIGVLLGVALSIAIHSSLWPEAEGAPLRQRLAGLLHELAALMRAPITDAGRYVQVWVSLASCEEMLARVALEPNWQPIEGEDELVTVRMECILAQVGEILLASSALENVLSSHATSLAASGAAFATDIRERAATAVRYYADELADAPGAAPARADALLASLPRVLDDSPALGGDVAESAIVLASLRHFIDAVSALPRVAWKRSFSGQLARMEST